MANKGKHKVLWTEEEDDYLRENYSYVLNADLVQALNKTESAIQHRATRLGLHKDKAKRSELLKGARSGEKSWNWKGGRCISKDGYIKVLDKTWHSADPNGYVLEHRYLMEKHIGRPLTANEDVHHINGDKQDNRLENLQIIDHVEHTILTHKGLKRSEETGRKISEAKRRNNELRKLNRTTLQGC